MEDSGKEGWKSIPTTYHITESGIQLRLTIPSVLRERWAGKDVKISEKDDMLLVKKVAI